MADDGSDLLLDHFRTPYHRGALQNATHRAASVNPLCGDEVELQLLLSSNGTVELAYFRGRGCVVSQAAASALCERIEAASIDSLSRLQSGELLRSFGLQLSPVRERCALLPFEALSQILASLQPDPAI